ncbi:hypothetical protein [Stappia indica]|uniref:hypothetical protein n=1 Tax=Stappia indica TaxID=538381 RepID=UPI001CD2D12E|nr:hypothetical protein [Stappia indica]MCA1298001.1 hypothetical protein [Stappia indica]
MTRLFSILKAVADWAIDSLRDTTPVVICAFGGVLWVVSSAVSNEWLGAVTMVSGALCWVFALDVAKQRAAANGYINGVLRMLRALEDGDMLNVTYHHIKKEPGE